MTSPSCVGLARSSEPGRFSLPVGRAQCGDHGQLYGGIILASGVEALEEVTGRQVAWATAQFTRPVIFPTEVELAVHLDHSGRRTTQGRVLATESGSPAFSVLGAVSEAADRAVGHSWATPPRHLFPPPSGEGRPVVMNPDRPLHRVDVLDGNLRRGGELDGTIDPTGRAGMWLRLHGTRHERVAHLAMLVDVVTWGFVHALGAEAGVATFDNTIRVATLEPTDWVLCDVQVDAFANGFAHGQVRLFSAAGTLLAVGAQSARLVKAVEAVERTRTVAAGRATVGLWDGLLGRAPAHAEGR